MKANEEICGAKASEEVLNSLECVSAESYLAAFGLGSSSLGIVLLAVAICFTLSLLNIVP